MAGATERAVRDAVGCLHAESEPDPLSTAPPPLLVPIPSPWSSSSCGGSGGRKRIQVEPLAREPRSWVMGSQRGSGARSPTEGLRGKRSPVLASA